MCCNGYTREFNPRTPTKRASFPSPPPLRPFSPYILYTNVPVYRFSIFLRVTKSCIPWLRLQHELSRARAGKRRKKGRKKAGHILHSRALSDEFKSGSSRKKKKLQEFIPKAVQRLKPDPMTPRNLSHRKGIDK